MLPAEIGPGSDLSLIVGLFANSGGAQRICFAVDLSGSMRAQVGQGHSRMSVVNMHLEMALKAHEGKNQFFGISTFTGSAKLPLGAHLREATPANIDLAMRTVRTFRAGGGNGGEPQCLRHLLAMQPDVVFFLGDGGWQPEPLIQEAGRANGVRINSIAFYTTGGGLQEIADMTGGQHREVKSIEEFHVDNTSGGAGQW